MVIPDQYTPPMQPASEGRKGAILCAEIQALIAIMRQNSKWALVPGYGYGDEDLPEDPLLEEFKILRRKVFVWRDWATRDPVSYLAPFLEVIRSVETSGPITGMALSTVHRVLSQGFVSVSSPFAAGAMHCVADAVAHCRFEETDHDSDEVVLAKILQALLACLRCPAGALLSDDDVCSMVQACFRIGHHTGKEGELLQQLVRQTMHEMVRHVFGRLSSLPELNDSALATLTPHPHPSVGMPLSPSKPLSASNPEDDGVNADTDELPMEGNTPGEPSVVVMVPASSEKAKAVEAAEAELGAPYGLPCVLEVFQFLVSLVSVEDAGSEDLCVFGLTLINSALEEGGMGFVKHPAVLANVQLDLFRGLLAAGTSSNLSVLSFMCTVFLNLYLNMRSYLKLQMEAFLRGVVLVLGDGRQQKQQIAYDQQRVVMEAIVDLCRQPSFMTEMYTNYDCSLEGLNMFEDLCALLSKNAFPVNCPLSAVHLLSLEGLVTVVHTLAERAPDGDGAGEAPAGPAAEGWTLAEYRDFWRDRMPAVSASSVAAHEDTRLEQAAWLRQRKVMKRQLTAGVEHFNRDVKKGFEYLRSLHLLPPEDDAEAVASFFRFCPGLDKEVVGEYLGDAKEFKVKVLEAYARSFDFAGMTIDGSLRLFLEGFKLPGEAQKISRILENFAEVYYQCSLRNGGVVADADSVYVLSYSIIMLNTDLHNSQVKRKMTIEQFISNNRGTNGGKDWPRQLLTDIYYSISTDEIKLSTDGEVSSSKWADVLRRSQTELTPFLSDQGSAVYDYDLFALIWGPCIAAMSVVFEHTDDEQVLKEVLDGFTSVAKLAAAYSQLDVMDNLVAALCKFTTLLSPGGAGSARGSVAAAAAAFGEDHKARMAAVTVFAIANKYGDHMRGGWQNLVDCVLRMHKLGLLPSKVTNPEGGIMTEAEKAERAAMRPAKPLEKRSSSTSSLFRGLSNQVSQLLSFDTSEYSARAAEGGGAAPLRSPEELEAEERTASCVEACRVDELFSDSKFLEAESLLHLMRALIWASGSAATSSRDDEETGLFCLEQVVSITLSNRDRVLVLWPLVYEHYADVIQGASSPGPLVERAVISLVRICQRLLPYKEERAEQLLHSLQLLFKLQTRVAESLLESISKEMLCLLKGSMAYIRSEAAWKTVCSLLSAVACHQEAAPSGFEALTLVMREPANVSRVSFVPCLEAALAFTESRVGGVERSTRAVDLLAGLHARLAEWAQQEPPHPAEEAGGCPTTPDAVGGEAASTDAGASAGADAHINATQAEPQTEKQEGPLQELYMRLVDSLARLSLEPRPEVRNHAVVALQRVLLAGDTLDLPAERWHAAFGSLVLPLLSELAQLVQDRSSDVPESERTLRMAVAMLSKTFLQYLPKLHKLDQFPELWLSILSHLERCMKCARSEELEEAIPESLKNILLVMASLGVLTPTAAGGLWDQTWKYTASISPSLQADAFGVQAAS
mmetsp:Transcript_37601/g.72072  ORF Transcript_37601/g.72072 Transcript_37601/m.72072 type:complete len:1470 (+) Transcript_37601:478-4887(+)|eukprot:CAMPEP_0114239900 /NCGR_PEP_ID=MMETSP0058-20121206/8726_1 /TAXON_ID=36894 /ORGANISM="Pyramimonas parkeae, CCMP726" /LENGTH=1469 /DNA_ID=CAMNT_0001352151 /DNA_START=406 /DNA_END=4815 /DNA_ORIENTATION=-